MEKQCSSSWPQFYVMVFIGCSHKWSLATDILKEMHKHVGCWKRSRTTLEPEHLRAPKARAEKNRCSLCHTTQECLLAQLLLAKNAHSEQCFENASESRAPQYVVLRVPSMQRERIVCERRRLERRKFRAFYVNVAQGAFLRSWSPTRASAFVHRRGVGAQRSNKNKKYALGWSKALCQRRRVWESSF